MSFTFNPRSGWWESDSLSFTLVHDEENVQSWSVQMKMDGLLFTYPNLLAAFEAFSLNEDEAKAILAGEIDDALAYCNGTEEYHKYTCGCLLTDGAKRFAEWSGAHWLLDIIASVQGNVKACTEEDRQFWKIIRQGSTADVFCWDGNLSDERAKKVWACPTNLDNWRGHLHYHQHIGYTDLVHDEFTLYAFEGGLSPDGPVRRIIMLPSEN